MTINEIYCNCVDVRYDAKVHVYKNLKELCAEGNATVYDDIADMPYEAYVRTDVVNFRVIDGNIHVSLGGEW